MVFVLLFLLLLLVSLAFHRVHYTDDSSRVICASLVELTHLLSLSIFRCELFQSAYRGESRKHIVFSLI
jgi:hypothetical protein